MSQENNDENYAPENNETYDLMMRLERLESLREEMEEEGFATRGQLEAALLSHTPGAKRELLEEMLEDLQSFDLPDTAALEREIDRLNEELDDLDD